MITITITLATAITLALLVLLLFLGMTAPVAIGTPAILYFFLLGSLPARELVATRVAGVLGDEVLVAIALFVVYGRLCAEMSARSRLVATLMWLLGGSAIAAKVAEVAASLVQPDAAGDALLNRNDEAAATVNRLRSAGTPGWSAIGQAAALALLRTITPPGVMLVTVAVMFNVSIAKLYLAMVPLALLGAAVYLFIANMVPSDGTARADVQDKSLGALLWLIVPLIVLGTIFEGLVTPTEAGALALGLALVIGLIQRELSGRRLLRAGLDSLQDIGAIYLVIVFASILSAAFAYEGVQAVVEGALAALSIDVIVGIVVVAMIALCALAGPLPTLFVAGPLLAPVVIKFGFDPLRCAIVLAVATTLGLLVPPVGPIFATLAIGTTERFGKVVTGIGLFSLVGLAMLVLGWAGPLWYPF